jgi:D-amino-acid dehydrogenase
VLGARDDRGPAILETPNRFYSPPSRGASKAVDMLRSSVDFDAVVLGAGVVGVSTAYWLARAGKHVCLIDRQPAAGLETSFANGGQISVSKAEPWANPTAPIKVLKWLFDDNAPLLFRPKLDIHQWLWIAEFLIDCLPHRSSRHTAELVKLGTASRELLRQVREREGIVYDQRSRGIIHFYRDQRQFDAAIPVAELMRQYGCDRRVISADQVVEIEPAFEERRDGIVGATFTADDESGDARKYTQALATVCESMGVTLLYGSQVVALDANPIKGTVRAAEVRTPDGYRLIESRDTVVSLGSYSAPFLRPYGVSLRIYPAKGYSVTIPIGETSVAPHVSLTDDEYKLVYSNLGDRLRIAGTAELSWL